MKSIKHCLAALAFGLSTLPALAAETKVAVAANFTDAAKEIAAAFQRETGDDAILSFGSTGQLFTQISQGAPYEVFLAADRKRPERAEVDGLALSGTRFTYAVGKLVLWSVSPDLVKGAETLKGMNFAKLAIANPKTAPYGAAAIEMLKAEGLYTALETKLVRGNNIAQTYQFVESGNAELGFVAKSQVAGHGDGSRWEVPDALHSPIRQDAVLLAAGAENETARAFLFFLKGDTARAIIEKYGYGADGGS